VVRCASNRDFKFGAHTRTHPALTTLQLEQARDEMAGSRRDLETRIDGATRLFAYPYGSATPEIHASRTRSGSNAACGVEEGLSSVETPLV
jgi:peptidoglycan/xylan/chitin deacetylase (PgdA/CDA1 family)